LGRWLSRSRGIPIAKIPEGGRFAAALHTVSSLESG
jgi:hypothetical protein